MPWSDSKFLSYSRDISQGWPKRPAGWSSRHVWGCAGTDRLQQTAWYCPGWWPWAWALRLSQNMPWSDSKVLSYSRDISQGWPKSPAGWSSRHVWGCAGTDRSEEDSLTQADDHGYCFETARFWAIAEISAKDDPKGLLADPAGMYEGVQALIDLRKTAWPRLMTMDIALRQQVSEL